MRSTPATEADPLGFLPDAERAARLDQAIRADLLSSVDSLVGRCLEALPIDAAELSSWIASHRADPDSCLRLGPEAFCVYAHLVHALLRQEHQSAVALFRELSGVSPLPERFAIHALGAAELDPQRLRYLSLLDIAGLEPDDAVAVTPDVQDAFLADHAWAMRQLEWELPELAGEIDALVRQLILVWAPLRQDQTGFDGGSSPLLWGALFINAARRRSPLELLEVLVHESAHLLLYAFAQYEPLVLNDDRERFSSPLRADPRPMEGIFHATWVSARMGYAMDRLSRSPHLDAASCQQAGAAARQNLTNVESGLAVIRSHARLTPTGKQLIERAAASLRPLGLSTAAWP